MKYFQPPLPLWCARRSSAPKDCVLVLTAPLPSRRSNSTVFRSDWVSHKVGRVFTERYQDSKTWLGKANRLVSCSGSSLVVVVWCRRSHLTWVIINLRFGFVSLKHRFFTELRSHLLLSNKILYWRRNSFVLFSFKMNINHNNLSSYNFYQNRKKSRRRDGAEIQDPKFSGDGGSSGSGCVVLGWRRNVSVLHI